MYARLAVVLAALTMTAAQPPDTTDGAATATAESS
jgi:hypothetical protein